MPVVHNLELDPFRPFVPSSPSNGILTEKEHWVATDPQSTIAGDSKISVLRYEISAVF